MPAAVARNPCEWGHSFPILASARPVIEPFGNVVESVAQEAMTFA